MPNPKTSLLTALLCGAALFSSACNKPEENQAASSETSAPAQVAQAEPSPVPQVNELQTPPPPPVVEVPPQAAPDTSSLDARERELKAREAELDARERRLREPAPAPAPKPRSKPAPAPTPRAAEPESAPAPEPVPAAPAEEPAPAPEPAPQRITTVTLPAGTQLDVELTRTLASNTSRAGDAFRVRIDRDVIEEGVVAIPAGSEVLGEVTEAVPLRKVGGQARLGLRFTDLVLPSGKTVPIDASFVQSGRSETGRDAATIGGAAAGGAILGRILNKGNRSKGSVLGAIIGAAAGTAIASKTPGEEVVLPQGSVVTLKLDRSIEVRAQSRD
jgi:type IV secretory pathway VirB10-like protein